MQKKILAFLLICIFCSGCATDVPQKNTTVADATNEPVIEKPHGKEKTGDKEKKDSEVKNDSNVYDLLDNKDKNCLELLDLRSRNIIHTISYKDNEVIACASEYKDGYAVLKARQTDRRDIEKKGGLIIEKQNAEADILEYNLELYNAELNKVDTISLLDYLEKDKVDKENIAYRPVIINEDATKVAFLLFDTIYCIDLEKKNTGFIKSVFNEGIEPDQIIFVGKSKIGFSGSPPLDKADGQKDSCYGYIDAETDSVKYKIEKDYGGFSLGASGKYLFMNDGEDPRTNSSSGKISILNCDTGETIKMQLDGIESTMSGITEDGTKLIAVKTLEENRFRIRNYDIASKEVVFEKICKKNTPIKPYLIKKIGDNKYGVVYADKKGMTVEDATNNK